MCCHLAGREAVKEEKKVCENDVVDAGYLRGRARRQLKRLRPLKNLSPRSSVLSTNLNLLLFFYAFVPLFDLKWHEIQLFGSTNE